MGCGLTAIRSVELDNLLQGPTSNHFRFALRSQEYNDIISNLSEEHRSRTNSKLFRNQDYSSIIKWCRQSGQLFVDPEFYPHDESLGEAHRDKQPAEVVWLRPGELCNNPRLVAQGTSIRDATHAQGELSNRCFLAACASIVNLSGLEKQIIPEYDLQEWEPKNFYGGIFHFQLYRLGEWIDVVVDDYLPTRGGQLIYTRAGPSNEFWTALLEKAYAKLFGGYDLICLETFCDTMEVLTGGVIQQIKTPKKGVATFHRIKLFNELLKAFQNKTLISASKNVSSYKLECQLPTGFPSVPGYSITSVRRIRRVRQSECPVTESEPMVRLCRLWGNAEFGGNFSNGSSLQLDVPTDDLHQKELGLILNNDREIWMTFDDFCTHFDETTFCHLFTVSDQAAERGRQCCGQFRMPDRAGGCDKHLTHMQNPQYLFEVMENGTDVVIALRTHHRKEKGSNEKKNETYRLQLAIYAANIGGRRLKKKPRICVATSGSTSWDSERCVVNRKFKKGRYVLVPCTLEPGHEITFLLRVYSKDDPLLSVELSDTDSVTSPKEAHQTAGEVTLLHDTKVRDAVRIDTTIYIHWCRGLADQGNVSADFYCVITEASTASQRVSPVYEDSLNPAWEYSTTFYEKHPKSAIDLEIRNKAASDELVGAVRIHPGTHSKVNTTQSKLHASLSDKSKVPGLLSYSIEQESS